MEDSLIQSHEPVRLHVPSAVFVGEGRFWQAFVDLASGLSSRSALLKCPVAHGGEIIDGIETALVQEFWTKAKRITLSRMGHSLVMAESGGFTVAPLSYIVRSDTDRLIACDYVGGVTASSADGMDISADLLAVSANGATAFSCSFPDRYDAMRTTEYCETIGLPVFCINGVEATYDKVGQGEFAGLRCLPSTVRSVLSISKLARSMSLGGGALVVNCERGLDDTQGSDDLDLANIMDPNIRGVLSSIRGNDDISLPQKRFLVHLASLAASFA